MFDFLSCQSKEGLNLQISFSRSVDYWLSHYLSFLFFIYYYVFYFIQVAFRIITHTKKLIENTTTGWDKFERCINQSTNHFMMLQNQWGLFIYLLFYFVIPICKICISTFGIYRPPVVSAHSEVMPGIYYHKI